MFNHTLAVFIISLLTSFGSLQAIDANVSFARFLTPDGAYLEIHTHIAGSTVSWHEVIGTDSLQRAVVDFTVILRKGEEIVVADRFALNSPLLRKMSDFVDLKRYAVEAGQEYHLELIVADQNDPENKESYKSNISIAGWPTEPMQSDIALLASVKPSENNKSPFFRHGLEMEPLPHGFYSRGANTLAFYNEIYASDSIVGDRVLILSKIERQVNGTFKPVMAVNKVEQQAPLIPHLQRMDISKLSSGRYLLVVEVRNEQNELVTRSEVPFYRSNPLLDEAEREELLANTDVNTTFMGAMDFDSLKYSVLALLPLMPQSDVLATNDIVRKKDTEALRMYLYSFWIKESPINPEGGYRDFMAVADFVNREFNSGFRYGFESDRGYIYIKYGRPSDISRVETDPTAPPYEIWSYNFVRETGQHNRRFIFYNPSLAAGGFELLHSDVIGERSNPDWQKVLYRNGQSVDEFGDGSSGMGRNADKILTDY